MTKEYILSFLKEHKDELQQKYSVTEIGLFGSYAKDEADEKSDIDLAISTTKKDFFIREELREYLQNHFKTPVDIGYFDSFREFYKQKIAKEILYA
ncbi:MAG: nucleotidyltransferase domain-containing protein [Sulfurimonas sp.]|nr:nucleotidyltransferase domain-containing protein [Sulfurimonas sp.]